jgi:hypothetical protein
MLSQELPFTYFFKILLVLFNPFEQPAFFVESVFAIVLGYGLYKVRAWAYWLFITYAIYTISINLLKYFKFGIDDLIYPSIRFALVGASLITVFYFIQKHIRAPYFNPRLRWWESLPRFKVEDMSIDLDNISEQPPANLKDEIYDISVGGLFIVSEDLPILGSRYKSNFKLLGEVPIHAEGTVVWVSEGVGSKPKGFGYMFTKISKHNKRQIKSYIRSLSKELVR